MVRLGNWSGDPALPARCRYRGITTGQAFTKITVSKSGDFAVVAIKDQLWFKAPGSAWADLSRIPGTGGFTNVQSISVATEKQNPEAQLLVVNGDGQLRHATFQGGVWSEFRRPWANLTLKQAALDLEGGNAQVVVSTTPTVSGTASGPSPGNGASSLSGRCRPVATHGCSSSGTRPSPAPASTRT